MAHFVFDNHGPQTIDGVLYDARQSDLVASFSGAPIFDGAEHTWSAPNPAWEDTRLYRTNDGLFWLVGEGGAETRWAPNGSHEKVGIVTLTEDEARELARPALHPAKFQAAFGEG